MTDRNDPIRDLLASSGDLADDLRHIEARYAATPPPPISAAALSQLANEVPVPVDLEPAVAGPPTDGPWTVRSWRMVAAFWATVAGKIAIGAAVAAASVGAAAASGVIGGSDDHTPVSTIDGGRLDADLDDAVAEHSDLEAEDVGDVGGDQQGDDDEQGDDDDQGEDDHGVVGEVDDDQGDDQQGDIGEIDDEADDESDDAGEIEADDPSDDADEIDDHADEHDGTGDEADEPDDSGEAD